jgi:hypothetical protein
VARKELAAVEQVDAALYKFVHEATWRPWWPWLAGGGA